MPHHRKELLNLPFQQRTDFTQDVNCESNKVSMTDLNAVQHLH